jgi:hypothetical protein
MRNHHTRLPIVLILIVLLSASTWAVAGASSRVSATWRGGHLVGGASTVSGEPDTPGIRDGGGGKATGGSSRRLISGDLSGSSLGIWIRLLQVRIFGL